MGCSLAGSVVLALADCRSRAAAVAGGAFVLASAALERWSVFGAGFQSARDPKYTVVPQRQRLRNRDSPAVPDDQGWSHADHL